MIKVSATQLRNDLFNYLDKAAEGETIVVQRNQQAVARLVPMQPGNWRDLMNIRPELLSTAEELIKPLEGIWEDYV